MTTIIFTSLPVLPDSIVRKSMWINSNRWVAVMGYNSVLCGLLLKPKYLSQIWIWFSISVSFLPSKIYLSESLGIFLSPDDLCYHGKLSLLVICNSGVIQTVMMVDYMNRIVFFLTVDHSWGWLDAYVWAWSSSPLSHHYVPSVDPISYSVVGFWFL